MSCYEHFCNFAQCEGRCHHSLVEMVSVVQEQWSSQPPHVASDVLCPEPKAALLTQV
jgi:hypothetical protein